jgi:hypothetical protein
MHLPSEYVALRMALQQAAYEYALHPTYAQRALIDDASTALDAWVVGWWSPRQPNSTTATFYCGCVLQLDRQVLRRCPQHFEL